VREIVSNVGDEIKGIDTLALREPVTQVWIISPDSPLLRSEDRPLLPPLCLSEFPITLVEQNSGVRHAAPTTKRLASRLGP
jgi:hypothetical protein